LPQIVPLIERTPRPSGSGGQFDPPEDNLVVHPAKYSFTKLNMVSQLFRLAAVPLEKRPTWKWRQAIRFHRVTTSLW
jgi:hypothetical protein